MRDMKARLGGLYQGRFSDAVNPGFQTPFRGCLSDFDFFPQFYA